MVKTLALICFLSLVMLMSILGNLLVMTAVCKDRQLRWVHNNLRASWVRSPRGKGMDLLELEDVVDESIHLLADTPVSTTCRYGN